MNAIFVLKEMVGNDEWLCVRLGHVPYPPPPQYAIPTKKWLQGWMAMDVHEVTGLFDQQEFVLDRGPFEDQNGVVIYESRT